MDPVAILRSARTKRGLTQREVADRTKLSTRMVAAIEDGRFDRLPARFYARAYIRMYAQAVGLDEAAIQPVLDAIPNPDAEPEPAVQTPEPPPRRPGRDRTAVAVDAAVVALISAAGVLCGAGLTGPGSWDALSALSAFVVLAVPTLILYVGLLGATGVGTVGARLLAIDFLPPPDGPLDGAVWLRRTYEYVRVEAVVLVGAAAALRPERD